jgi:hypothetical protein
MSTSWYYVEDNERVGPVPEEDFVVLIKKKKIILDTYVWKKGFENWTLLKEVEDYRDLAGLQIQEEISEPIIKEEKTSNTSYDSEPDGGLATDQIQFFSEDQPEVISDELSEFNWSKVDIKERIFTIRIGKDRGVEPVEYGPFSLEMIKSLIDQNRANMMTEIFTQGMDSYQKLGDISFFNGNDQGSEKRKHSRAPLVARLFFHDSEQFFEGVCRDISIGGMQILVSNFQGQEGDVVKLNVHPVDDSLQFTAEAKVVRRLTECNGVSVRFVKMTPDNLEKINKYIELYEE